MPTVRSLGNMTDWLIEFINEWPQFGPDYNWRTWHVFEWEIEDDRMMGAVETSFIVLGIGLRVRYTYVETDTVRGIKKTVEEIKAGTAELVPFDPEKWKSEETKE